MFFCLGIGHRFKPFDGLTLYRVRQIIEDVGDRVIPAPLLLTGRMNHGGVPFPLRFNGGVVG
jgi:hypothetical protein